MPSLENIDEFIEAKNTFPGAIISPDSVIAKKITTYANFNMTEFNFQTLNGAKYECRTNNRNGSTVVILWINDGGYILDKNDGDPLFTFDARLNLSNSEILDYQYIYYVGGDWFDETLTDSVLLTTSRYQSASEVNTKIGGKYPVFHVFSLDEDLSNALETIGFDTQFSKNQTLFDELGFVSKVQWKLRSRINTTTYFAAASYKSDLYKSTSDGYSGFYSQVENTSDLAGMVTWVNGVFPGWT